MSDEKETPPNNVVPFKTKGKPAPDEIVEDKYVLTLKGIIAVFFIEEAKRSGFPLDMETALTKAAELETVIFEYAKKNTAATNAQELIGELGIPGIVFYEEKKGVGYFTTIYD